MTLHVCIACIAGVSHVGLSMLGSTEVIQLVSLLYYICSHFPGGTSTLNLLGRMGGRSARAGLKKHLDDLETERIVGFCCFAISVPTSSVAVYCINLYNSTVLQVHLLHISMSASIAMHHFLLPGSLIAS